MTDSRSLELPLFWADSKLDRLDCDYDQVRLFITEHTGVQLVIVAEGWISLSVAYFWDDSFIDDGRLLAHDPRIDAARETVGRRPGRESGNLARNRLEFQLLEIDLDDGARFECIASSFEVQRPDLENRRVGSVGEG